MRDQFQAIVEISIEVSERENGGVDLKNSAGKKSALRLVSKCELIEIEETAAIMEVNGRLTTDEADRAAFSHYFEEKKRVSD
jgi:hypothetical protein